MLPLVSQAKGGRALALTREAPNVRQPSHSWMRGMRVLIAEDSFLLADQLASYIRSVGGEVMGPFPDAAQAFAALDEDEPPTAALLDIRLADGTSYALAAALRARGVAVVFTTGYDVRVIEPPYDAYPICLKPAAREQVLDTLSEALGH
jgi:DNA-binding LytR/AlgR family response regulator